MANTDRASRSGSPGGATVAFVLNGELVSVAAEPAETLLSVLRERLGITSVKDGCAPQGQCGCCTVLIDGAARVACVTPVERVEGRAVTTVEGLAPDVSESLAAALCASGGSQCGFCTPGIIVRLAGRAETDRSDPSRALAAHLCRCTGWQTIVEGLDLLKVKNPPSVGGFRPLGTRDLDAAGRRAELEGGVRQRVAPDVPLGHGGFADDTAPRDALVAVPDSTGGWVVAPTLHEARRRAGKVQGRNTPSHPPPPFALPPLPAGGVRLATSWVEPAYLETDASWCEPGGQPASPLANGGAFGAKLDSIASGAARHLAAEHGRAVRVVLSREDTVRLGPKRPPIAASAVLDHSGVHSVVVVDGTVAAPGVAFAASYDWPYGIEVDVRVTTRPLAGPPVSDAIRAAGWAEQVVLVEGALEEAGVDRTALVDAASAVVLLDTCALAPSGARAGASVAVGASGEVAGVRVKVAAGDPLDEVVVRSYAIGAVHMALGWVLSESIAVDPESGEVLDLTIRSFGILRARETPPIEVEIVDAAGPPLARSSDAVFAATAAAAWNALTRSLGTRPEVFPSRPTR